MLSEVLGLIQQENVAKTQGKGDDTEAIEKPDCDEKRQHCKPCKMQVHPGLAPGMHPVKAVVAEMKAGDNIVVPYPAHVEVTPHFDQHDDAETDAENRKRGGVYGSK